MNVMQAITRTLNIHVLSHRKGNKRKFLTEENLGHRAGFAPH